MARFCSAKRWLPDFSCQAPGWRLMGRCLVVGHDGSVARRIELALAYNTRFWERGIQRVGYLASSARS